MGLSRTNILICPFANKQGQTGMSVLLGAGLKLRNEYLTEFESEHNIVNGLEGIIACR